MVSIRRFLLLNKRLFRQLTYMILLLIIPLSALALRVFTASGGHLIKVAVYADVEKDAFSKQLVDELSSIREEFHIELYESSEAAIDDLRDGVVDEAWIIPNDLGETFERMARGRHPKHPIEIYVRENTVPHLMMREILQGYAFKLFAPDVYFNYLQDTFAPNTPGIADVLIGQPPAPDTADADSIIGQPPITDTSDADVLIGQPSTTDTSDADALIGQPSTTDTADADVLIGQPPASDTSDVDALTSMPSDSDTEAGVGSPLTAERKNFYSRVPEGSLFEYSYVDGDSDNDINFLLAPVRGFLAIILAVTSLAASIYYLEDEKNGLFIYWHSRVPNLRALGYYGVVMINSSLLVLISLYMAGVGGNVFREILLLILYDLALIFFSMIIRKLLGRIKNIGVSMPIIVMMFILLSPMLIDLKNMRPIQKLVPTFHYLTGVHSDRSLLNLAIYCVVELLVLEVMSVKKRER